MFDQGSFFSDSNSSLGRNTAPGEYSLQSLHVQDRGVFELHSSEKELTSVLSLYNLTVRVLNYNDYQRLHKIECYIHILRYSRLHSTVEICHLIHFASNETEKCPSIDIFSIDFTSDAPSVLLLKLRQCYVITGSFKVEKCLLSQQMSTRRSKWWPKKLPPHRRYGAFQ